jgi:riboflavin kinase/FMN adenylyltransferase
MDDGRGPDDVQPAWVEGVVVAGEQRGRILGFPTANLIPEPGIPSPPRGVYACIASLRNPDSAERWPAAVSIGVRPMFESRFGELIEAHLLDFSGDLYGRVLRLDFIARLRDELSFSTVDALKAQIEADVERTREAVAAHVGAKPDGATP